MIVKTMNHSVLMLKLAGAIPASISAGTVNSSLDPMPTVANTPAATAKAIVVPGGYRVTGRQGFSTGCRHASWLAAHAQITENGQLRLASEGEFADKLNTDPKATTWVQWIVMSDRREVPMRIRVDLRASPISAAAVGKVLGMTVSDARPVGPASQSVRSSFSRIAMLGPNCWTTLNPSASA